ncbi:MAG: serine/threonine-protein kinase [Myxococcota bacterium]
MKGETIAGRFRLEGEVGKGGMGKVYRAKDLRDGDEVAVKVLLDASRDDIERFRREARVLERLAHATIVAYRAHGVTARSGLYLAMEWVQGETLASRIARGPLSVEDTVSLGTRVAEALGVAHSVGVLHRDIKPANIMLPEGDARVSKVLDFGVARMESALNGIDSFTEDGQVVGTPGYLAPEQARGDPLSEATDLFALGAVLFECVTGRRAFGGASLPAVLASILFEPNPRVSELVPHCPPALDELITRLLSKAPAERPPSAKAVATALEGIAPPRATPRMSTPAGGVLFREEAVLASCVAARPRGSSMPSMVREWSSDVRRQLYEDLEPAARFAGARLEVLADGTVLGLVTQKEGLRDQAETAARLALACRQALPTVPVALATGRGVLERGAPVGQVVESVLAALDGASLTAVTVDEATAALLRERFQIVHSETLLSVATDVRPSWLLLGERDPAGESRTLLGQSTSYQGRDAQLAYLSKIYDTVVYAW